MLALSLDISNAFNSLPWDKIMKFLRSHGVLDYLVRILKDYLRDRRVTYGERAGSATEGKIYRGVPQGFVLGPLLWNIGYNSVLRTVLPPGCSIICYADNTIVLAGSEAEEKPSIEGKWQSLQ